MRIEVGVVGKVRVGRVIKLGFIFKIWGGIEGF